MQRKPLVIKRILGNGYIRCSRYPPPRTKMEYET